MFGWMECNENDTDDTGRWYGSKSDKMENVTGTKSTNKAESSVMDNDMCPLPTSDEKIGELRFTAGQERLNQTGY